MNHEEVGVKTRYSTRKATTCKVTLSCGARVGEGMVMDLTVPGCLLETAFLLEPGQSVQLRVHLDNHRPMRIDLGVVRWAKQGNAGIEFIRMAGDDQHRLRFYVGHIEKRPRPSTSWGERPLCVGF
jgi:hypothetical protein